MPSYTQRLTSRIDRIGSHLCVGLDPRPKHVNEPLADFIRRVVEETRPFAAAFKPNLAYFEQWGSAGYAVLESLRDIVPDEIPLLLDAKRSDIPETQRFYARATFEGLRMDAVTINPLLGFDSIEPYLRDASHGVYLLAVTSNPGAADLLTRVFDGAPFFERILDLCERARAFPACVGLVAGLTNLTEETLARLTDVPLLIPGYGVQGGALTALNPAGRKAPFLINSSRGILFGQIGSLASRARDARDRIAEILDPQAG